MVVVAWSCVGCLTAAVLWMMWLYLHLYRQYLQCNRDRNYMLRRLGQYHSLPLTFPNPDAKPDAASLPPETPVPPAFRMKRPRPI
jgi:hypothetical protein